MIWYFISVVMFIVLAVAAINYLCDSMIAKVINYIWGIPFSILLGIVMGFCFVFVFGAIGVVIMPSEEIILSENEIVSISDNMTLQGHFALGSGYVDENLCIFYVIDTSQGKKIDSVKADNAVIIESNTEKPNIVIKSERYKHKWINIFLWDIRTICDDWDTAIITVPEDTITVQYNIDLE